MVKDWDDLLKKAEDAVDVKDIGTQSGKARMIDFGNMPNPVAEYFNKKHEEDLDNGKANPFFEFRKRGRPSLEKLMRRDFAALWNTDFAPAPTGFLGALLSKGGPAMTKGRDGIVRIKFVRRGS